jgi:DUF971 family protein
MCQKSLMQHWPAKIQKASETEMSISWNSGETTTVPFRTLRFECQCAECVDEWTRVRRVKLESIRSDIKPQRVETVGRYAIQIAWSDGHSAGIYPFEALYEIAKRK